MSLNKLYSLLLLFLLIASPCWGGVDFNGDADYINLGSSSTIDNVHTYTICAWFYADTFTAADFDEVAGKFDTAGKVLLEISNVGGDVNRVAGFISSSSVTAFSESTDNAVSTGSWTHYCSTFDNSGDRKIYMYIDGVEVTYDTQRAMTGTITSDASASLYIGAL